MDTASVNYFIAADEDKCLGCKSCEIACALAHAKLDLQDFAAEQKAALKSRITVGSYGGKVNISLCRHCEEAPCAQACRIGAIVQVDGSVRINEEKCVGCKLCIKACPFSSIAIQEVSKDDTGKRKRGTAVKCDLCAGLKQDVGFKCACVEACPTHALSVTNSKEDRARYPGALDQKLA